MFEFIALVVIGLAYAAGFLVSLYSLAVYIDPDEVPSLFPSISESKRHFLKTMAENSRASLRVATVFKSFQLVLVSVLAGVLLLELSAALELRAVVVLPIGLVPIWFVHVLVVEFMPRRYSRTAINLRMLDHLWLIRLVHGVFLPIVGGYQWLLRRAPDDVPITEEEKEDIIERAIETLADQAGIDERIVEDDEKQMIGQIFQLDQTVVREIMVPRIKITGIEKSMLFSEIQKLVAEDGHSRFPVYEESIDRVIGILYVKDLFNKMPAPGEKFQIHNYLREPYIVPELKVIGDLLREFKTSHQHIALVVDEYGGLAGLVTLEDIIEEIVGDIQDEHDMEELDFFREEDGAYLVDASVQVYDLLNELDLEYEHEDFDTVGGLMYGLYGSVPPEGARVKWHDLMFEITRVERQRILQVRVRPRRRNGAEESDNGVDRLL
jgi:magnesium and cobalt transporter